MEEILKLLTEILNFDFIRAVISNPRDKTGILKVKVRPLEKNGGADLPAGIIYKNTGIP